MVTKKWLRGIAIAAFAVLACLAGQPGAQAQARDGAVYTMTNAANGNAVAAYTRSANGALTFEGLYPTGGRGSGGTIDPLQSQSSLLLSDDNSLLFAVNAGSGEISVFAVRPNGRLNLVEKFPCGGALPVSLAAKDSLLYVLNAGGNGNISGFQVRRNGRLAPLAGSTQPLSASSAGGASIAFNPDGTTLAVTERLTNRVNTYAVGPNGLAQGPLVNASNGLTPFSLAFTPLGDLLVAESFGGPPTGDAAVSSYALEPTGALRVVSGSVPTLGTAACWIVVTRSGRYAYVSNAGSGTITGLRIGRDGALTRITPDGRTGVTGAGSTPLDLALTRSDRFLYTLNAGAGTISGFRVETDGSLTPAGTVTGPTPASGQNGLAAF